MNNHFKRYFYVKILISLFAFMSFQNIHAQSKDQAGGITPGTDCTEKGTAGETCASTNQTLRCVRSPNPSALPMNSCSPYPCQFVQPITGVQTVYITKLPQSINLNTDSCAPSTADAYIPYSMPANTMDYKSDIRFEFNPSTYGFGLQSNINKLPANYSFIYTKYIVHDAPNCTYSGYSAPGVPTTFTVLYGKTIDTYTSQSADATHTCASYKVTPTCMYGAGFNTAPGSYLYCYNGCTGPDGAFIPNGGSKDYYKVNQSLTCASQVETRVCTNGSLSGSATYASCNTTINGLCGSASGTSVAAAPSTSTDLCSAGTPSAVTGTGPWKWSCAGAYGGSTQSCSANQNGCGWQGDFTLASNSESDLKFKSKMEMFAWLVSGAPRNSYACPVDPGCDLPEADQCTSATYGNHYSCGVYGCPGAIRKICNCSATAKCGSAASTPSATSPTSNLCAGGLASKVTDAGAAWTWDCMGAVGGSGTNVSCSTSKSSCTWVAQGFLDHRTCGPTGHYDNGDPNAAGALCDMSQAGAVFAGDCDYTGTWGSGTNYTCTCAGKSCTLPAKLFSANDATCWDYTSSYFPANKMADGYTKTIKCSPTSTSTFSLSCSNGVLTYGNKTP